MMKYLGATTLALVLLAGCSTSSTPTSASSGNTPPSSPPAAATSTAVSAPATSAPVGTAPASIAPATTAPAASTDAGNKITVLAAASLTGTFTQLGKEFQTAHPGVTVTFSFGSSADLATQITEGAPADVFAAASPKTMQTVVTAKQASDPITFASNSLEIATPPDNPAEVVTLADLSQKGLKLALCQAQVPCGATAATMFAKDKITVHPVTLEKDVKSTLAKVVQGEVDAGVVYVTDVLAAGKAVRGIAIPASQNVVTAYPIAALTNSKHAATAKAFVGYVTSTHGLAVLKAAGFAKP